MQDSAIQTMIEFRPPSPFWQRFGTFLARAMGWRILNNLPDDPRMVLLFFPHTSNMDVLVAIPAAFAMGLKPNWLVKDEIYRGVMRPLLDRVGAIPINRHRSENKVGRIVEAVQSAERVMLALSPEGTRKRTEFWRSGFYHIAMQAQIPIHYAYIDYPSKTIGGEPGFIPSGDIEADLDRIRAFYADKRGKHPERVGPIRFR